MAAESTAFEGWAIVELMGHRRLAGYVRQAEQFGVAMLRLDVPEHPWVDGCTCGSDDPTSPDHEKHTHICQAYRPEDDTEIKDVHATQFYGGSSIYCLTPTTEEVVRAVATRARPTPASGSKGWRSMRPDFSSPATPPGSLPDAVRATGVRAIGEMRHFGAGMVDGAEMRCPREYLRSVAALHDHLRDALLTVDSMVTAGASPGTIHAVIEEALRA